MSWWKRRIIDPLLPVDRFTTWDRRIVLVIWVAGVVQGFAQAQASSTLPFTRAGLGLSEGEMSLLLGLARLAAFAALPIGWLSDRIGRRRPLLWSLTLVVVGGALSGLALEAWQYGFFQAILRTGTAAMTGLAIVLLAEHVSPLIRAYAISFYGAAGSLGGGLALLTLPLADGGGQNWRIPYLLSALGLLVLPFLIRSIPESKVFEKASEHHEPWRPLLTGAWSSRFWTVGAVGFMVSAFGSLALAFSTTRMIDGLGLTTGQTVLISLIGGTLGALGFFVGGHLADSWGRRYTTVLSLVLALVGGMMVYWIDSAIWLTIGVMVSSFGLFAYVPAGGSHRAELFPTPLRGRANTAAMNLALAGSAAGLILGVFTIDMYGIAESVTALGIGMVVASGLTLTLPETVGQSLEETGVA